MMPYCFESLAVATKNFFFLKFYNCLSRSMSNYISLFKMLKDGEELLFQSKLVTPVIFFKEAMIKKLIGRERKGIPII